MNAKSLGCVVGVLLCLGLPVAHADIYDRVDALVAGGAPHLALRLLEKNQPSSLDQKAWMAWEKRRLAIYAAQGEWAALVDKIDHLPDGLPPEFVQAMWLEAAKAKLAEKDGAGARVYLRRLLWQQKAKLKSTATWRELVVRSYLDQDAIQDARRALTLYREDFHPHSAEWTYLYARVLLRAGDASGALKALAGNQTFLGRVFNLLARLRSKAESPARIIKAARTLEHQTRKHPDINRQVWALLAEAAGKAKDESLRVSALEHALPVDDKLFDLNADTLWDAYIQYAEKLGNAAHLLIGNDAAWLAAAAHHAKQAPVKARAMYALLATRGDDATGAARGGALLLKSLYAAGEDDVAHALFLDSQRFAKISDLPPDVRYILSDHALKAYDIHLAAKLVDGLDTPPPGEKRDSWLLRKARLAIYAGNYVPGVKLIDEILNAHKTLDEDQAEAVLQVLFDLQTAGQNAQAYELFQRVHDLVQSIRLQRETLFWMGESRAAQGDSQAAAELYLRSAFYKHPAGDDMWAQAARYSAADALGKAGLTEDARGIYKSLLALTNDPKRRAVIQRNMQQLWLLGPSVTTP